MTVLERPIYPKFAGRIHSKAHERIVMRRHKNLSHLVPALDTLAFCDQLLDRGNIM